MQYLRMTIEQLNTLCENHIRSLWKLIHDSQCLISDYWSPKQSFLNFLSYVYARKTRKRIFDNWLKVSVACFNDEQRSVFNTNIEEILRGVTDKDPLSPFQSLNTFKRNSAKAYFLDALGGTGKTFTIRAIHALLHLRNRTVLPVATSKAVAASLLPGGCTALSVFKIPIPCFCRQCL